jgi:hypothetical protein
MARELFEARAGAPLLVWIHFVPGLKLSKESIRPLAKCLAGQIGEALAVQGGGARLSMDDIEGTQLDGVVVSAKVSKFEMTEGAWVSVEAGFVSSDVEELRSALTMKEPKREAYLERCDEIWLVIVASGGRVSAIFNAEKLEHHEGLESRFDRVVFFDLSESKVIRLV